MSDNTGGEFRAPMSEVSQNLQCFRLLKDTHKVGILSKGMQLESYINGKELTDFFFDRIFLKVCHARCASTGHSRSWTWMRKHWELKPDNHDLIITDSGVFYLFSFLINTELWGDGDQTGGQRASGVRHVTQHSKNRCWCTKQCLQPSTKTFQRWRSVTSWRPRLHPNGHHLFWRDIHDPYTSWS